MARYSVVISRFDGGYNSKVSPLIAPLNESPDLQNVVFDDLGAVETRLGRELFTSAGIASAQIDMLHSFIKDNGTEELMTVCNTTMYRLSGNTAIAVASATSLFTIDVRIQALNYQNQMWMSNGGINPYKWNGTEFTQWGIPTPSAPTAATTSDGTLTGSFKYVILGVNSNLVQGDYGSESAEISATSDNITISDIPVFPISAGVNNKQICRNTANASGVYLVVTEISNAQTSYVDNADDSELLTEAPLDQGYPSNFSTILSHQGRVFGASSSSSNPTYLWYSILNTPEAFPSENFLRIGDGDGYPIVGLALLSNSIIVAKNDGQGNGSTWLIYMPDTNPINWTVTKLDTESGGQSANVMAKFNNFLAYLNRFGVFDISEFAVGDIRGDPLSFNIEPDIFALSQNFLNVASAITWKNKVWFSVPYGDTGGSPTEKNNRIYQYDFIRGRSGTARELGAWSKFTDINISILAIHSGELYGGSSADDGILYKLDTGRNDAGDAIDSYFKTMAISGLDEHKNHTKVWRFAYFTFEAVGEWFINVEILTDFDLVGNISQADMDPGGIEYGVAILDTDFWGSGLIKKRIKISFDNAVSKSIQFKISTNTADEYFKLNEIEVFYNLRGLRTGDT